MQDLFPNMQKRLLNLGPLNQTAHKVNENINLQDLDNLEKIYYAVYAKFYYKFFSHKELNSFQCFLSDLAKKIMKYFFH
jgi:hypothetical protein